MTYTNTSQEIVLDCLSRIKAGDVSAPFDLASAFMSHADSKNVDLFLAVVEGLAVISSNAGCKEASDFLQDQWSDMKISFRRRWLRAGFIDGSDSNP